MPAAFAPSAPRIDSGSPSATPQVWRRSVRPEMGHEHRGACPDKLSGNGRAEPGAPGYTGDDRNLSSERFHCGFG